MRNLTYRVALKDHAALKRLGQGDVYLSEGDEFPWQDVVSVEPGGSHRLDISTTVWITAVDKKTGLRFRWSAEIENRSADGQGSYEIDTDGCRSVIAKLHGVARDQFRKYLAACAVAVRAKAVEWRTLAEGQAKDASILAELSAT